MGRAVYQHHPGLDESLKGPEERYDDRHQRGAEKVVNSMINKTMASFTINSDKLIGIIINAWYSKAHLHDDQISMAYVRDTLQSLGYQAPNSEIRQIIEGTHPYYDTLRKMQEEDSEAEALAELQRMG